VEEAKKAGCGVLTGSRKHMGPQLSTPAAPQAPALHDIQAWNHGLVNPVDISNPHTTARRWSGSTNMSNDVGNSDFSNTGHVPHPICKHIKELPDVPANRSDQTASSQLGKSDSLRRQSFVPAGFEADPTYALITSAAINGDLKATRIESTPAPPKPMLKHRLPDYLKPLPQRMTSVDIDYLFAKGALSLPDVPIRNALLRGYLEYVHPYMPLVEFQEVLQIINDGTGASGRMSLLLFQAIMFAGTAFVDIEYLRSAGYSSRKAARKAFFQKARVCLPASFF